MSTDRQPVYQAGCAGPACSCQVPHGIRGGVHVFSTGDRKVLVERGPDYRGLLLTDERLARTRFFEWRASA